MSFLKTAKKRRSTKIYNDELIELKKLNYIFEFTNTAPSSMNLEPWRVISIRDKYLKDISKEYFFEENQKRYVDCSDALIFVSKTKEWFLNRNPEILAKVRRNMNQIAKEYGTPTNDEEKINNFLNYISTADHGNNDNDYTEWSKRQAYLASSFSMLAATESGINSTPIEGFSKKFDDFLKSEKLIKDDEVVAIVILLGYIKNAKHAIIGDKQLRQPIFEKFQVK